MSNAYGQPGGSEANSSSYQFFWCLKHNRVETDDDKCDESKLLGPFPTRYEAENALQRVHERNAAWEAEDERWHGERD